MFPVTVKLGSTERNVVEYAQVLRIETPVARPELTQLYLSTISAGYNHTHWVQAPLKDVFNMMVDASKDAENNFICDLTRENLIAKGFLKPRPAPVAEQTAKKPGFFQRIGLG